MEAALQSEDEHQSVQTVSHILYGLVADEMNFK